MTRPTTLHRNRGTAAFVALFAVAVCCSAQVATAADKKSEDPAEAREMIEHIRRVVLPQQKKIARELIRKYPNSELAKLAQELLDEYKLYDELAAAEQQKDESRLQKIRDYWDEARNKKRREYGDAQRPATRPTKPHLLQITNLTDEPVLYQVKGPAMDWSGPFRLRADESHRFHSSVIFRRVTKMGLSQYSLSAGQHYVFRRLPQESSPRLFQAARSSNLRKSQSDL